MIELEMERLAVTLGHPTARPYRELMTAHRFRRVPAADAAAHMARVQPIFEEAFPREERIGPVALADALGAGTKSLWLAETLDGPAGFAVCQPLSSDAWLLEYLATRSESRSAGLGRSLLADVREGLERQGGTWLYLEVEPVGARDDGSWQARRLRWYVRQGAVIAIDSQVYAIPSSVTGEPLPMTLLAMALRPVGPPGPRLCHDVRDLFSLSYDLRPDHPLVVKVLGDMGC